MLNAVDETVLRMYVGNNQCRGLFRHALTQHVDHVINTTLPPEFLNMKFCPP